MLALPRPSASTLTCARATALSIAGIICEHYGVLCSSGPWSFKTAHAYISVIDGVSITIALYGLLIFYGLTKDELKGRKPLAKFLSIKLIVMFTFYQSLVVRLCCALCRVLRVWWFRVGC